MKYIKDLIHIERPMPMFVDGPWKEYAKRYVKNPRSVVGSYRSSKSSMSSHILTDEEGGDA